MRPFRLHCWIACVLLELLVFPVSALAVCASTDSCLQAVDAAQRDLRTISARFVQTKHVSLLDEPLVSTGRFFFARPDRMRLQIETPQPMTIVINGRDIAIPGLRAQERQAMAGSPMTAMFTELGALFAGSTAALRDHFTVEAAGSDGLVQVTLTPRLPEWQKLFRTIVLRFAPPAMTVRAMRLDDALGDRLEIEMSDVRRNEPLPDALFETDAAEAR